MGNNFSKQLSERLITYCYETESDHPVLGNDHSGDKFVPLTERLKRLLDQRYSLQMQREGLSLRELQVQLKGRKGRSCHHSELADSLEALGFQRQRGWNAAKGGFRALWVKTILDQ